MSTVYVFPSMRGHFLLLRYPPPTNGWSMGIGSLDLYQAVPLSFAHACLFLSISPNHGRVCVPYIIYLSLKNILILYVKYTNTDFLYDIIKETVLV